MVNTQALRLAALALKQKKEYLEDLSVRTGAVEWIQRHFWVPELKGPMMLAPYQRACMREALSVGPDGLLKYSTIVWSDLKKSIKSTIAAAVLLWWADTHPWSSIKVIANDLKQADSREAFYARRAVELNREYFQSERKVRIKPYGYTIEFPLTHSRIEAIPIDPAGEAGANDDMVCYTELWAWRHEAAQRLWTESTLSPVKYGKSLRWVETYAGFTGESPVLERLYEAGVTNGEHLDLSFEDEEGYHDLSDLEVFANRASRIFCLWNTKPRLPWLTEDYYRQEAAMLLPREFERVHRNQWVGSEDEAIPLEWWDQCFDYIPLDKDDKRTPLVLAVDASVSGDCCAINVVSRHPDKHDHVVQRACQAWTPPKGGKMDYDTTISPAVDWWIEHHNVVEVAYDPYQLHHWANQQRNKPNPAWYREFAQGPERLVADKRLVDVIRQRELHHCGDPTQRTHIGNCNAKVPIDEPNKLRLVKKGDSAKIDLAVTLSMAAHECLRLNL